MRREMRKITIPDGEKRDWRRADFIVDLKYKNTEYLNNSQYDNITWSYKMIVCILFIPLELFWMFEYVTLFLLYGRRPPVHKVFEVIRCLIHRADTEWLEKLYEEKKKEQEYFEKAEKRFNDKQKREIDKQIREETRKTRKNELTVQEQLSREDNRKNEKVQKKKQRHKKRKRKMKKK